jgi:hypothetical protein
MAGLLGEYSLLIAHNVQWERFIALIRSRLLFWPGHVVNQSR